MELKYFLECWPSFIEEIQQKFIYLLLDFDGTLSPIAPTPSDAVLPAENRRLLEKLSKLDSCHVVFVSGRALADLERIINLSNVTYIGNHGYEIQGKDIHFESLIPPDLKNIFQDLTEELTKRLANIQGWLIEHKGLSMSIHYRLVDRRDLPAVQKILRQLLQPLLTGKKIKVYDGKEVTEVRPPVEWDKGKAILWLLKKRQHMDSSRDILPIFWGDDATDEDAFEALQSTGVTIMVGEPRATQAEYYLKDQMEVTEILKKILDIKKKTISYA